MQDRKVEKGTDLFFNVNQIREALNHELVLGRDDFKAKIQQMTLRQTKPKPLG